MIIAAILSGILGFLFGIWLAFAAEKWRVEEKGKVDANKLKLIVQALPKINCGKCGYAGCGAFAKAVLEGDAPPDGCVVGKEEVAKKIKEIVKNNNIFNL